MIQVIDCHGRTLTPCRRKVADREVRLGRAKWIDQNRIRLRFDPFAYRYIRLKVLARDGYTCYWCGGVGNTMDHVVPWSKGGRTTMANCICACEECNGARGDMPAEQFARIMKVKVPRPDQWGQGPARAIHAGTGPRTVISARAAVAAATGRAIAATAETAVTGGAAAAVAVAPAGHPAPVRLAGPAPVHRLRPGRSEPLPLRDLLDPYGAPVSARLYY